MTPTVPVLLVSGASTALPLGRLLGGCGAWDESPIDGAAMVDTGA